MRQNGEMWIWRLGLGLWWTLRLGLKQIQSLVGRVWIKDVSYYLQLCKDELKLKFTFTLTQNANPSLCVRKMKKM